MTVTTEHKRRHRVLPGVLALGMALTAAALALPGTAQATTPAVSRAQVAGIAEANLDGTACGTNSAGGRGYYSSCTGNGGAPEYWCADFAKWVWSEAGVTDLSGLTAAAHSFYDYGVARGLFSNTPAVGDAVVFSDDGTVSQIHHVAIVGKVNPDGTIETISGDWNGQSGTEAQFASTSHVIRNIPDFAPTPGSRPAAIGQYLVGFISPPGATSVANSVPNLNGAVEAVTIGDRYDVFGRTADDRLLQWTYVDQAWHGPTDLGGPIISAPAVTVDGTGRYDVFAVGSDHSLIHRIFDGTWHDWEHLGGVLHFGISVVNPSPGRFDVFSVDTDYHLVQKIYAGGVWTAWNDLGGVLTSAPDVVAVDGRYDVFATDTDHHLVQKIYADGVWTVWNDLGGVLTSAPSVTRRGDRYDVYATDTDYHLVTKAYNGSSWTVWQDLGGQLTVAPAVVNPAPSRYDVFAANTSHYLIQKIYNGSWNPWNTITTTQLAS